MSGEWPYVIRPIVAGEGRRTDNPDVADAGRSGVSFFIWFPPSAVDRCSGIDPWRTFRPEAAFPSICGIIGKSKMYDGHAEPVEKPEIPELLNSTGSACPSYGCFQPGQAASGPFTIAPRADLQTPPDAHGKHSDHDSQQPRTCRIDSVGAADSLEEL